MSIYPTINQNSDRILVIGAGVVGLTTAFCLLKSGFPVTILADKFSPETTSNVAGALWEWPPAVCGHHRDPLSLERSKQWCMVSYDFLARLAQQPATGVHFLNSVFFFRHPVSQRHSTLSKMNEIETRLQGFRHDSKLIEENGINPHLGLRDAYEHLAPVVHTDIYLTWLLHQIRQLGGQALHRRLFGSLVEQEDSLKSEFSAAAIVNCAGLGSRELAEDPMYPLRGALLRVHNDGRYFPPLRKALSISLDERDNSQNMIYLVPRENILLLGGLVEKDQWSTDITLENYTPIQQMYERCLDFLPLLQKAQLVVDEPVRVGLRPARQCNVRLEEEQGTTIIHNYGHGGSGITLSWGCGQEVVARINSLLRPSPRENLDKVGQTSLL